VKPHITGALSAERQQTQVPRIACDTGDDVIQCLVRRRTNLASRQGAIAARLELRQAGTLPCNSLQILRIL
jgi:hypothetical protein